MVGTYLAEVKSHVLKEVGDNATPAINIALDLIKNVQTDEPVTGTVYASLWLTDAALEFSMRTMTEALGWTGTDLSEINGTGMFAGKEVWVVLEEQEYEGKTQTKVKYVNKVGGQVQKPFNPVKAKILTDKLKGKMLAYRQKAPAAPAINGLIF